MRTIKFRGKNEKTGEWEIGFFAYLHISDTADSGQITRGFQSIPSIFNDGEGHRENSYWKTVDQKTVGQFTGLLDRNGKEIYEGDIVKARVTDGRFRANPKYENLKVYYDENRGRFSVNWFVPFVGDRFEVIGNIHDNPELLKGGAK